MAKAPITTTANNSLLSFTPSRPFFPRGFLWDEGFHLLPVIEWDLDLAVSVVRSWLNLMDEDGWIGRKYIAWSYTCKLYWQPGASFLLSQIY